MLSLPMSAEPPPGLFYMRDLPDKQIALSSKEGRLLFREALNAGNCEGSFFELVEHFGTQSEIAFCGLTTLSVVLNSLNIDPWRGWKGPWRWYHERMLDCCISLKEVEKNGITLESFLCLAKCNSLDVTCYRAPVNGNDNEKSDFKESFLRDLGIACCTDRSETRVVCYYSRKVLGQTGDGHYSPIGAFTSNKEHALILDVARFKYPPHWASVDDLCEAMRTNDPDTGKPRGYIVLRPRKVMSIDGLASPASMKSEGLVMMLRAWSVFPAAAVANCLRELTCPPSDNPTGFRGFLTAISHSNHPILRSIFLMVSKTCGTLRSEINSLNDVKNGADFIQSEKLKIIPLHGPEVEKDGWEGKYAEVSSVWFCVYLALPEWIGKLFSNGEILLDFRGPGSLELIDLKKAFGKTIFKDGLECCSGHCH